MKELCKLDFDTQKDEIIARLILLRVESILEINKPKLSLSNEQKRLISEYLRDNKDLVEGEIFKSDILDYVCDKEIEIVLNHTHEKDKEVFGGLYQKFVHCGGSVNVQD